MAALHVLGSIQISLSCSLSHWFPTSGGQLCPWYSLPYGKKSIIGLSFHPLCTCEAWICTFFNSCLLILVSVRLPIGVMALVASFTGSLSRVINPKWVIVTGQVLVTIGTLLLAFADRPDRYWSFIFPGLVIGSTGAMLCYTHTKFVTFISRL
jgi:hypothetical protein